MKHVLNVEINNHDTIKLSFFTFLSFALSIFSFFCNFKLSLVLFIFLTVILSAVLILKNIINYHNTKSSYKILFKHNITKNLINNHLFKICQNNQVIIIHDKNINNTIILESIIQENKNLHTIKLNQNGEMAKSFNEFETLINSILTLKPTRNTVLIALGGGSVGDLVGFCASVLLRGIKYIQYPTTLLSMVDSSVGGKTAINSNNSKNMIGSFYQPSAVICDWEFLQTLNKTEFLSGYAEVLKYGIIWDKKFFQFLLQNQDKTISITNKLENKECFDNNEVNFLNYIIYKSCNIKSKIVSMDEKETKGIRELLNFGHTIGHGIEKCSLYKNNITHGQAVAIGMIYELKLSAKLQNHKNTALNNNIDLINKHYQQIGLTNHISKENIEKYILEILQIITLDKKNISNEFVEINYNNKSVKLRKTIKFIKIIHIGKSILSDVDISDIMNTLIK